ncbi:MAG: heat repeat-containing lyase [Enterovirga sp.]|jgi:HEAT repeat protein|nr:heat repeat-containing lyase [Enterovirga sp.]
MPLVKRPGPPAAPPPAPAGDPFGQLRDADPDTRRTAARALATEPGGPPALGQALAREQDPRVRDAITTSLMRAGSDEAVLQLLPHLRSDDASLRTLVIEALQGMPAAVSAHLPDLLADADPDVRLLAAEIARTAPSEAATALLADALAGEQHPNVAGAMVEVLAEIGTADAIDALHIAQRRFAAEPFLTFAVEVALERLNRARP